LEAPPADIAQLPMAQQQAYCNAYNQHTEENPEADEEECDAAGRAAIEPRDSADAAANLEAVRAAYQADYVRRISNAWKT
jgi:ribulose bisphosphate carboxylase small subunit